MRGSLQDKGELSCLHWLYWSVMVWVVMEVFSVCLSSCWRGWSDWLCVQRAWYPRYWDTTESQGAPGLRGRGPSQSVWLCGPVAPQYCETGTTPQSRQAHHLMDQITQEPPFYSLWTLLTTHICIYILRDLSIKREGEGPKFIFVVVIKGPSLSIETYFLHGKKNTIFIHLCFTESWKRWIK